MLLEYWLTELSSKKNKAWILSTEPADITLCWGVYALSLLLGLDPAECHGIIITHFSGYRVAVIFPHPHPKREPQTTASFCLLQVWKNRIWLCKCKACKDLYHLIQTSTLHKRFKNFLFEINTKDSHSWANWNNRKSSCSRSYSISQLRVA